MTDPNRVLHIAFHQSLTLLVAEYTKATNRLPIEATILDLENWSYLQTLPPRPVKVTV